VATQVEEALRAATDAGVIVVASAGNDGALGVRWPARLDSVIAVASVDSRSRPASWTSYGAEVDLVAPGQCVYTTRPPDGYRYFEGTSASAPIVAGLAALLVASHPSWSVEEIVRRMRETSSMARIDAPSDILDGLGAGLVDFSSALSR
jgi:subtilisin